MRVWVARAEPAASRTARRLRELGHAPLVAPILAIVPRDAPPPAGPFDAILLTSANALIALSPVAIRDIPVFAVGRRTAEAARAAGFASVIAADGDAAALAALVRDRLSPGAKLLHPVGEDRKPEPARTLRAAGYDATPWIAYAAEAVPVLPKAVSEAFETGLDAVLHYSRRSAAIALALASEAGREGLFRSLRHLCLSTDVAIPLVEAGIPAHFVPARPDEASLLAGLADPP